VQDVLVEFLERLGLFVHVKLPGEKKSKSVLLYHEAPTVSYCNYSTLDGEDLPDIGVGERSGKQHLFQRPPTEVMRHVSPGALHDRCARRRCLTVATEERSHWGVRGSQDLRRVAVL
jgi:hypothetical protein